jgi:hypothetical protein
MARWIAALALAALIAPAPAAAEEKKFELGARLGIGFPGGEYGLADGSMANDQDQSLVVGADGNFEVMPSLKVGAFAQFMVPRYDTNNPNNGHPTRNLGGSTYVLGASVLGMQLGVRVELGLGETKVVGTDARPWGALFAGWEKLTFSYDATALLPATNPQTRSPERSYTGFLYGLEAGVDAVATPAFTVGPYFSVAFGKFSNVTTSGTGNAPPATGTSNSSWLDRSFDIDSKYRALHLWTSLGLRGRFAI